MSSDAIISNWDHVLGRASKTTAQTFRLALGTAGAFITAEILGWSLSFLAPVIAALFLARPGPPPPLVQAIVVIVTIVISTTLMLIITNVLIGHIVPLILVLGLILFLTFYAHFRGAPAILTLLVQISVVCIPVLSVASSPLASGFRDILFSATVIAFLFIWIAHAAFPAIGASTASPEQLTRLDPIAGSWRAVVATIIVMPMLIWYLLDAAQIAIVLLIVVLQIVRFSEWQHGARVALGLVIGNIGGGVAAVLVYHLIEISQSTLLFALLVLLACLLFASKMVRGGISAPLYGIAFSTFLILLGLGLTPLPGGSEESFASRLFYVLLGTAYAVAALSIVGTRRRGPV